MLGSLIDFRKFNNTLCVMLRVNKALIGSSIEIMLEVRVIGLVHMHYFIDLEVLKYFSRDAPVKC